MLQKGFRRAATEPNTFPNDFCYSISSLDEEHLFRLFPFGSALCSAQTTIKHGSLFLCSPVSFISIMNSFPMFLLIFLPQWWIPSVLVPMTQLLFCCPPYMAAPCCRVGTWQTRHNWPTTDSLPSGTKGPAHSRVICGAGRLLSAGNGRLNHHFASCCVIILTIGVSYWIHFHIANIFAVMHKESALTMDP